MYRFASPPSRRLFCSLTHLKFIKTSLVSPPQGLLKGRHMRGMLLACTGQTPATHARLPRRHTTMQHTHTQESNKYKGEPGRAGALSASWASCPTDDETNLHGPSTRKSLGTKTGVKRTKCQTGQTCHGTCSSFQNELPTLHTCNHKF